MDVLNNATAADAASASMFPRLAAKFQSVEWSTQSVTLAVLSIVALAALVEQVSFRLRVAKLGLVGPSWVVPFVGGIVSMVRAPFDFWHTQFALGKFSWTSIVGQFTVVVTDAAAVRRVFQQCSERLPLALHPNAYTLLGKDNIAFLNGDEHRQLRARLLPFFTPRALEMYVDIQVGAMREFMARWRDFSASPSNPLMMRTQIYDLNTHTSCSVFMGPYLDPELRRAIVTDYQLLTEGMFGFPINLPGFALYRGAQARPRLLASLQKVVEASKKRMANADAQPKCLLDFWMQSTLAAEAKGGEAAAHTDSLSCAKILLDFLFASQDASTSSLTWATHLLSLHTDVLAKLRAELATVQKEQEAAAAAAGTPQPGLRLDATVLPGLTYTQQVVREVLRLCPPATIVPHQTAAPYELESGRVLPKGTLVVPSIWNSNRTGFSAPESFDPDRFSEARGEGKTHANEFLTFGTGPHSCMGQRYAINHLVCFVAMLAHEHDWTRATTPDMHKIKYLPTIYPEDDCPLERFGQRQQ